MNTKFVFNEAMICMLKRDILINRGEYTDNNIQISCYLSPLGGTLRFVLLKDIPEEYVNNFEFGKFVQTSGYVFEILIEPEEPTCLTEPYNRSIPYHIPTSFSDLNLEIISKFNIYSLKNIEERRCLKEMRDFYFNNVWNYYSFDTVVCPENLQKFISTILLKTNIPVKVVSRISDLLTEFKNKMADVKIKEYFEESCGRSIIMDIITPLVSGGIPNHITNFSEQNVYMRDNFRTLFEKEYGFKPFFKINDDNNNVYMKILEDMMSLERFVEIVNNFKKIKERLKGFNVFIITDNWINL